MSKLTNITLYLMGEKGYATLLEIVEQHGPGCIKLAFLANDKNVMRDYVDEMKAFCFENTIPCATKGIGSQDYTLEGVGFAIGWRWLIKVEEGSRLIVMHDSLLPESRGWAPLVQALISGDTEIGVSAFIADDGMDTGDLIQQESKSISYPIHIQTAIQMLTGLYGFIACKIIRNGISVLHREQTPSPSYSMWRDRDDYAINWKLSAYEIQRFIHATGFPYTGAKCQLQTPKGNSQILQVIEAEIYPDKRILDRSKHVGKVFAIEDDCFIVVCGGGLLKLTETSAVNGPKALRTRFL